MTNNRRRNERRSAAGPGRRPPRRQNAARRPGALSDPNNAEWLWGWHAVVAALENPARGQPTRLVATGDRARTLRDRLPAMTAPEILDSPSIGRLLPGGAVHQGIALATSALAPVSLEQLADPADGVIVMLDQVTDPQNIGAIFRSAAAFGVRGVILQERRAPALAGALAKAAAGAVDRVAHVRTVNLARALERLEALGWRAVGLDAAASQTLADVLDGSATVLVAGAEHEGLRRLVREHCDVVARIDMAAGFDSLNVAAATAVALYEATRRHA